MAVDSTANYYSHGIYANNDTTKNLVTIGIMNDSQSMHTHRQKMANRHAVFAAEVQNKSDLSGSGVSERLKMPG